jgi:hypothetical protein
VENVQFPHFPGPKRKKAGSFGPAIPNPQPLNPFDEPAQPAFFAGPAAVFFSIWRFSSSARTGQNGYLIPFSLYDACRNAP